MWWKETEEPEAEARQKMIESAAAIIGCGLNMADRRTLALGLVVGLSICAPLDPDSMPVDVWYMMLIAIEISVSLFAILSQARIGIVISSIHAWLAILHGIEWATNPYDDGVDLYTVTVPALEMLSLSLLCFTSRFFSGGYNGIVAGRSH